MQLINSKCAELNTRSKELKNNIEIKIKTKNSLNLQHLNLFDIWILAIMYFDIIDLLAKGIMGFSLFQNLFIQL